MLSIYTWKTWIHALRLIPATWRWSLIQSAVVVLVPGITVIILDWACRTFSIQVSETNPEANVLTLVVILYSIGLVLFSWAISIQNEETTEAQFFRNLPISRWGSILTNSLKGISFTLVVTLSLASGFMIVSAEKTLFVILILAYIAHLLVVGTTLIIITFFSPYLRTWSKDNRHCIYTLSGYGWFFAIIILLAKVDNVHNLDQIVLEIPWLSYLLPLLICTILSWMAVYGIILLPVVIQRSRNNQVFHRVKPNLFQKDMLRREPPGVVTFPLLLRSWGGGFLPMIALIVFIGHLRDIDFVPLLTLIEPRMPIAGFVLIIVGALSTIAIAFGLLFSVSKVIFFIPLWHTLRIPDRWVPNFFAVGIYTLTIVMGIDWILSDRPIDKLLAVGMIPFGIQILCSIALIQNPSTWGHRQQNVEGFAEGMVLLSLILLFFLVLILGSFGLILLAIPLACVGTIYSYWFMHWMWKRY